MCCARDSSRIDMIMNIYREKEGEKRRSSKCTNGSLVSPLIMNAFLSPFFSLFFFFSFSSDCRSGGRERERERKDNWTVSFSPMRERERENGQLKRVDSVYVYSVDAAAERLCSSTSWLWYQFSYSSWSLDIKLPPYSFLHSTGIRPPSGMHSVVRCRQVMFRWFTSLIEIRHR